MLLGGEKQDVSLYILTLPYMLLAPLGGGVAGQQVLHDFLVALNMCYRRDMGKRGQKDQEKRNFVMAPKHEQLLSLLYT